MTTIQPSRPKPMIHDSMRGILWEKAA
jgi:hypothetical protein